jgi:hypothetical protein
MTYKKYNKYSDWWNANGIYVIIFGSIFLLLILFLIYKLNKSKFKNNSFMNLVFGRKKLYGLNYSTPNTQKPIIKESKGEIECKKVLEQLFNKPFHKIRPKFLFNDITKQNLELDLFNEELKLAVEYNGKQHYEYIPYFHKTKDSFYNQQYRDQIKKNLCEKNNIILIDVPYNIKIEDIKSYLINQINKYPRIKQYI